MRVWLRLTLVGRLGTCSQGFWAVPDHVIGGCRFASWLTMRMENTHLCLWCKFTRWWFVSVVWAQKSSEETILNNLEIAPCCALTLRSSAWSCRLFSSPLVTLPYLSVCELPWVKVCLFLDEVPQYFEASSGDSPELAHQWWAWWGCEWLEELEGVVSWEVMTLFPWL